MLHKFSISYVQNVPEIFCKGEITLPGNITQWKNEIGGELFWSRFLRFSTWLNVNQGGGGLLFRQLTNNDKLRTGREEVQGQIPRIYRFPGGIISWKGVQGKGKIATVANLLDGCGTANAADL